MLLARSFHFCGGHDTRLGFYLLSRFSFFVSDVRGEYLFAIDSNPTSERTFSDISIWVCSNRSTVVSFKVYGLSFSQSILAPRGISEFRGGSSSPSLYLRANRTQFCTITRITSSPRWKEAPGLFPQSIGRGPYIAMRIWELILQWTVDVNYAYTSRDVRKQCFFFLNYCVCACEDAIRSLANVVKESDINPCLAWCFRLVSKTISQKSSSRQFPVYK